VNDHCCSAGEGSIRVLIADDAARSRDGLRALLATLRLGPSGPQDGARLQVEVVGEAANGQEAMAGSQGRCANYVPRLSS
jgi:YesN/AraC family two-component response regulator